MSFIVEWRTLAKKDLGPRTGGFTVEIRHHFRIHWIVLNPAPYCASKCSDERLELDAVARLSLDGATSDATGRLIG